MIERESQKASICRYLVRHTTLSLATCDDGRPWSTDLFYASDDDWKDIRGLQLDGVASAVSEADRDAVVEICLAKFPALKKLHQASEIFRIFRESSFYRVSPEWIRLIDNSKVFGHKDEMFFYCRIS